MFSPHRAVNMQTASGLLKRLRRITPDKPFACYFPLVAADLCSLMSVSLGGGFTLKDIGSSERELIELQKIHDLAVARMKFGNGVSSLSNKNSTRRKWARAHFMVVKEIVDLHGFSWDELGTTEFVFRRFMEESNALWNKNNKPEEGGSSESPPGTKVPVETEMSQETPEEELQAAFDGPGTTKSPIPNSGKKSRPVRWSLETVWSRFEALASALFGGYKIALCDLSGTIGLTGRPATTIFPLWGEQTYCRV